MRRGDIVRHFKWETISEEERKQNKYLYCIKDVAEHTETGQMLIIYQAMYSPFKTYARPSNMFLGEVDHKKYPNIKQRYRFEKHDIIQSAIKEDTKELEEKIIRLKYQMRLDEQIAMVVKRM